jgi:thymidylate synthase ThyX
MSYKCEILKDSINPLGTRLTTMRLRFPRFILAEFNTHRKFSRNAGSSRAISIKRRIEMVDEDPVFPHEWGLAARTMHAEGSVDGITQIKAIACWRAAAKSAITFARQLENLGIHKQVVNRILEPFSWVDVIVSSTEWSNFFHLRVSPLAQPEMRYVAELMQIALQASTPSPLGWMDWHIPLADDKMVAVGRIARVSYEAEAKTDEQERELAKSLMQNGHWSPFEHIAQAKANAPNASSRNFDSGWVQWRAMLD